MARRGDRNGNGDAGTIEWPVHYTCVGLTVVLVFLILQAFQFVRWLFAGQCTTLIGMCTPAQCSCEPPLIKRQLVTQDAEECFQCISQFCPDVSGGDETCSRTPCECSDLSSVKMEVMIDGEPCWQCVQPAFDLTLRNGMGGCLALAHTGEALVMSNNVSECVAFRYNSAQMVTKRDSAKCLEWHPFGEYWSLDQCNSSSKLTRFRQLQDLEAVSNGPPPDVFCTGNSEFCIEAADRLCTEDRSQCTAEQCRCDDPTWTKQELHTWNGTRCYSCIPPMLPCAGPGSDTCTLEPCECTEAGLVKHQVSLVPSDGNSSEEIRTPCVRCGLPPSNNTEAITVATILLCILLGLGGGIFIRTLQDPAQQSRRHASEEPRAWSERCAEELEDLLKAFWNFGASILRYGSQAVDTVLDACDAVLEPAYEFFDVVQAYVWDCVVLQHERLLAVVNWAKQALAQLRGEPAPGDEGKRKRGPHGRRHKGEEQPASSDIAILEFEESEAAKAPSKSTKPVKAQAAASVVETKPVLPAALIPTLIEEVADASPSAGLSENLAWDPLNLSSGKNKKNTAQLPLASAPQLTSDFQSQPMPKNLLPAALFATVGGMGAPVPPGVVRPTSGQQASQPAAAPAQSRAQRKLQQRREALQQRRAAAEAAQQQQPSEQTPIDDSWIDELEKEVEQKGSKSGVKAQGSKAAKTKERSAKKTGASEVKGASSKASDANALESLDGTADAEEDDLEYAAEVVDDQLGDEDIEEDVADESAADKAEDTKEALFDSDRLLSEVMHGLFLLSEGDAAAAEGGAGTTVADPIADLMEEEETPASVSQQKRKRNKRGAKKDGKREQAKPQADVEDLPVEEEEVMPEEDAEVVEEVGAVKANEEQPEASTVDDEDITVETDAFSKEEANEGEQKKWQTAKSSKPRSKNKSNKDKEQLPSAPSPQPEKKAGAPAGKEADQSAAKGEKADDSDGSSRGSPVKKADGFEERGSWRSAVKRGKGPHNLEAASPKEDATPPAPCPFTNSLSPSTAVDLPQGQAAKTAPPATQPEVFVPPPPPAAAQSVDEPSESVQLDQSLVEDEIASSAVPAPPAAVTTAAAVPAQQVQPQTANASAKPAAVQLPRRVPSQEKEVPAAAAKPKAAPRASAWGSPSDGAPKNFAQVVASWANAEAEAKDAADQVANNPADSSSSRAEEKATLNSTLVAGAPEFVPLSMMQQPQPVCPTATPASPAGIGSLPGMAVSIPGMPPIEEWGPGSKKRRKAKRRQTVGSDYGEFAGYHPEFPFAEPITTVLVSGLPPELESETFRKQLDVWGLLGTYNFFFLPVERHSGQSARYSLVNFIDPAFSMLFYWLCQEYQCPGTITPAEIQGVENNIIHWRQYTHEEYSNAPVVIPNPVPTQWAVSTVNTMLSPQYRAQFHKTKPCIFNKKNRCELGSACPFAHSEEEMMPAPDLAKTKLCYNFFRGSCEDANCKFAHGFQELRFSHMASYRMSQDMCGMWDMSEMGYDAFGMDTAGMPEGIWTDTGMMISPGFMPDSHKSSLLRDTALLEYEEESGAVGSSMFLTDQVWGRGLSADAQDFEPGASQFGGTSSDAADSADRRSLPTWTSPQCDGVALRLKGTFMEAMQIKEDEPGESIRRSWSEGDLQAFREAMEDCEIG
mmetsp:Transcript_36745/g.86146  ORF Transcript_36745/g.86146 Transcript_36745/m.86146 type:complete len:1649 (+) Transcript_36745:170-5116(+)|eukprot:CAMPEP_0178378084 /NCGR_PEP_ID=MMETSP0689_2-20121128/4246_1 /TAXON_ID=160604 /ORGANISM="Amphidinium massartii, Strain CS-259" /LENGTH=1648 /DNA_ID=CAMNT_0019998147 /DNA_START=89 /DNA_END=5035 /DNA_ORIENTATION=+